MIDQRLVQRELRRSGDVRFAAGLSDLERARLFSGAFQKLRKINDEYDSETTHRRYELGEMLSLWQKASGDTRIKGYVDKFLQAEVKAKMEFRNLMEAIKKEINY